MLSRTVQLFSRKQTLSVVTCLPCDAESFLTCAPNGCGGESSKDSANQTLCSPKLHPLISSVKLPFTFPRAGTLFTRSPGCSLDPISFGLSHRYTNHMQTRSLSSASVCVKNLVSRHSCFIVRNNHLRNCILDSCNCKWSLRSCFDRLSKPKLENSSSSRHFCDKSGRKQGDASVSKSLSAEDETLKLNKVETAEVKEWLNEIREDFKPVGIKTISTGSSDSNQSGGDVKKSSGGSGSSGDSSSSEYDTSSESDLEDHVIKEVLDHAEFYSDDGHKVTKSFKKLQSVDLDEESKFYSDVSEYAEKISSSETVDVEEAEDLLIDIEEFSDYESDWEEEKPAYVPPIPLIRGKDGVFDLEDLLTLLREEKVKDLCVIRVPSTLHYVDYLVLVTAMSKRHNTSLTQTIHWVYKRRKAKSDPTIHIEKGYDWTALDLGNIALHIMMADVREEYDIETLWTCGSEYDEQSREIDSDPYAFSVPPSREQMTDEHRDIPKD